MPDTTRSALDDNSNTPLQPPPTPEPLTPKDDISLSRENLATENKDTTESKKDAEKDLLTDLANKDKGENKRRASIQKKERKPSQRTRKSSKAGMETKEIPKGATPPGTAKAEKEER